MTGFDCRPVSGRRRGALTTIAALGFACLVSSQAFGQETPAAPQPPAQPAQPAPAPAQPAPAANPFVFGKDAALIAFIIKPEKAADFELVMSKMHDALANSDKPERKQQAASWKLFKAAEAAPNGNVIYYNIISPVLKGADYAPSKILAEVFPTEAQQMFLILREAFAGVVRNELTLIRDFSGPAPKTPPLPPPAQK